MVILYEELDLNPCGTCESPVLKPKEDRTQSEDAKENQRNMLVSSLCILTHFVAKCTPHNY